MSRWVDVDKFEPKEDRRATVERVLASVGVSLDDSTAKLTGLPETPAKPTLTAEAYQPEAFIQDGGPVVSIELARMVHATIDLPDPETDSLEGMLR